MQIFPTKNLTPEEKILEYQDQLSFIQSELKTERNKLAEAKSKQACPDQIRKIEQDISYFELGIDQAQAKILQLKAQIK